jgi:small conductance mechanosensitive channel
MNINDAYHLISTKLTGWLHELIRLMPNILLAAVVLVLGIFLAGKLTRIGISLINRVSSNSAVNNLFGSVIRVTFIGITIFTVLSILNLDKAVTSILAGAGILGLGLAFAFQDIAANFMSGIFISFRKPFHIGHMVKLKDYMGKVEEINLRDTVLRTFQGEMVILPNKDVFQNPMENFSLLGKRRIDLSIGVSYGENLEKVRSVTLDAIKSIQGLSAVDDTTLFFREFEDSSINLIIRIWVNSPEQVSFLSCCSEAIISIKKAYDASDILIPFPIRTLDFGIKGGVQLKDMLAKA